MKFYENDDVLHGIGVFNVKISTHPTFPFLSLSKPPYNIKRLLKYPSPPDY